MAVTDIGVLSLVKMTTPALTVAGIVGQDVGFGIQAVAEGSDGAVDPTFVCVMNQNPSIGFSTRHVAVALAGCGISGCEIAGLDTYFQKVAKYGTRTGGATSLKFSIATGMMYPVRISARHNQDAEITYRAIALSTDGLIAPVVLSATGTMPSGSGISEKFTAGPVKINGAAVAVESIDIDFGIQVSVEGSDGGPFPTFSAVMARNPIIRVRTPDRLASNVLGLSGAAQGATDSVVYLRKLAKNGTRTADATAEHISFTIDDGMMYCSDITNRHGQRIGTEIVIHPIYDGSIAILVIDPACAIA